jgi:glycosyltransferase involved in cell wall biosynthesis
MRVGIDVSPLALTRAGTARYIRELISRFEREEGIELRRYHFGRDSRPLVPVRDVAWYLGVLPMVARRDRVDILHCPTHRAPIRTDRPLVVTFHDVAVLRHPEVFNRWTRSYSARLLPKVVAAATRIIAVSEFTKGELLELLDAPDEKVTVVPNGVGPPFETEGPAETGDYVLTVSTLEPRKNLSRLVEGFHRAGLEGVELRVAGAVGWGGIRVGGEGVRWLGEVGDEELARLYRGARCVAYVSLYEGFGLPVLEAMACGAPVVTTAWGACAEVAGGAAVLVDALDPEAIAVGLVEAIGRRAEVVAAGRTRAAGFTWERAASETLDVYRGALA